MDVVPQRGHIGDRLAGNAGGGEGEVGLVHVRDGFGEGHVELQRRPGDLTGGPDEGDGRRGGGCVNLQRANRVGRRAADIGPDGAVEDGPVEVELGHGQIVGVLSRLDGVNECQRRGLGTTGIGGRGPVVEGERRQAVRAVHRHGGIEVDGERHGLARPQVARPGGDAQARGRHRGDDGRRLQRVGRPGLDQRPVQQDADVAAPVVGSDDIGLAVPVHVTDGHRIRVVAGGEIGGGGERAVPVPQQHADIAVVAVGGDEVGLAIAVHVDDRHRIRPGADRDGRAGGGGERAVSIPQQHADGAVVGVGGDEVGLAVPVHVTDHH